jgi:putative transposase
VLAVAVHAASLQDRDGAKLVFEKVKGQFTRLKLIWADGAYAGQLVEWVKNACGWLLEIVRRNQGVKGFQLLPRRWVVERTFGWFGRYRRLSKDYEFQTDTSENMVLIAMIQLMVHRLARNGQLAVQR